MNSVADPPPPAPADPLRVSFVVVTMNRRADVLDCLASVAAQAYPEKEIVVVDNASRDGTAAAVRAGYPGARLIALDSNLGATGGRNRGLEAATGEICVVLDDDATLPDRAATARTVAYFTHDPALACVAFRIVNAFTGADDRRAIPRRDKKVLEEEYACTYFCAAGFAIRRSVALEAGLFWTALGMYGEELDLAYRVLDRGHRMLFAPSVVVAHRESPAARPAGRWLYHTARNRCWIAVRNLPWPNAVVTTLAWWAFVGARSLRAGEPVAFLRGVRDALVGLPLALGARSRLGRPALAALREHAGRVWY